VALFDQNVGFEQAKFQLPRGIVRRPRRGKSCACVNRFAVSRIQVAVQKIAIDALINGGRIGRRRGMAS